jgi:hypothetical protein
MGGYFTLLGVVVGEVHEVNQVVAGTFNDIFGVCVSPRVVSCQIAG